MMEPMAKTVISSGENSRLPVLVSKLVSNGFGYIPFSYKKSYIQRKTTAKAVVFMVAEAGLDMHFLPKAKIKVATSF